MNQPLETPLAEAEARSALPMPDRANPMLDPVRWITAEHRQLDKF